MPSSSFPSDVPKTYVQIGHNDTFGRLRQEDHNFQGYLELCSDMHLKRYKAGGRRDGSVGKVLTICVKTQANPQHSCRKVVTVVLESDPSVRAMEMGGSLELTGWPVQCDLGVSPRSQ